MRREPEADAFLRIIAAAEGYLLSTVSLFETSLVLAGRQGDARSWTELTRWSGKPACSSWLRTRHSK